VSTNRTVVDHYLHANHSLTFYTPPDSTCWHNNVLLLLNRPWTQPGPLAAA
jgi:hypothetical protein